MEADMIAQIACGDRIQLVEPNGVGGKVLSALNATRLLPPSSSGLGHHPFKVAARVRIPLGVLIWSAPASAGKAVRGPVVKWSSRRPVKPEVAGSNPVGTARNAAQPGGVAATGSGTVHRLPHNGRVAQLAEHTPEKRGVTGSTPVSTTTRIRWPRPGGAIVAPGDITNRCGARRRRSGTRPPRGNSRRCGPRPATIRPTVGAGPDRARWRRARARRTRRTPRCTPP